MKSFRYLAASALLAVTAASAQADTFNVFEAGTATLLGSFDAPAAGGAVATGSFSVDGGVFDVLGLGASAPLYSAADSWITGTPGGFGAFYNSVAYNTFDIAMNPITCGIGECVLSFTNSGDPGVVPAEWYLDYLPGGGAAIDFGYYEIEAAAIPLPAGGVLLLTGLGAAFALRRRR